ncbi:MAG TPA: protein kinase [Candidatus Eisenbacteria bacterium]|nr:protein kinase [Candidatus Eisenbacteria bacterium]
MPLAAGARLGPYEISAPLGHGGMGEVYRARDTRLGREVAVKILPAELTGSAEVRARFEREARTISQLNHPHICVLHDVGRDGDTDYLVMELVDGETLAQRLERGALSIDEVLRIGAQIADALDRAHRAGVVHRDLKPGNIMLTRSGAKLMDFGLARATGMAPGGSGAAFSQSPTIAQPLTAEGTIVGTFQYMAPEQLEGKESDARSDLWALGCVLYEMLTRRRAFEGKSQASLISSIMKDEPRPITELVAVTPPALDQVVRACMAKDPEERLQTAHDVRLQLQWIAEAGSRAGVPAAVSAKRKSRERLAWGLAAISLFAVMALVAWGLLSRAPRPDPVRADIQAPAGVNLAEYACDVVISPDGRAVAFIAGDRSSPVLWIRPLGSDAAIRASGVDYAQWPFWSPDSRNVAYFDQREGKLMKIPVAGGSPITICEAKDGRGGSWSRDGTIVFAPAHDGPLMRVASGGGEPVAVTRLDTTRQETGHRFPYFLPDGDHFLYAALPGGPNGWDIYVGSVRTRSAKRILTARSSAVYAEPGYLLFERDGRVVAQRFDPGRLELKGEPVAVALAPLRTDLDAEPVVSASRNGRLARLRSIPPDTRLEIRDRSNAPVSRIDLPPAPWTVSKVSPDGQRATLLNGRDIWIVDLARSVPMRFASTSVGQPSTVWSPDGERIAFVTAHAGREEIHVAGLDGQAEPMASTDDLFKVVYDWSRDGRSIVFGVLNPQTGWDLWVLSLGKDGKPVPYLRGAAWEFGGRVSPDGRWLAYESTETGQSEIYVQSFPEPGRKVRVSPDGGRRATWASDGRELLYWQRDAVVAVPMETGETIRPGVPRTLFATRPEVTSSAVLSGGERFLVSVGAQGTARDIELILDWTAMLKR